MRAIHRLSALLVLLVGLALPAALASSSRKLAGSCEYDKCGIWCGPPRPPPCGNGNHGSSYSPSRPAPEENYSPNEPDPYQPVDEPGYSSKQPSTQYFPEPTTNPPKLPSRTYTPPITPAKPRHPAKPSHTDPPLQWSEPTKPGCYGEKPFGLDSCACQGADIGKQAGVAACGRVVTECQGVIPFGENQGMLKAIDRVCDTLALDSCIGAAQDALLEFTGCADILQFGTPKCTPQQAWQIFTQNVDRICDPICRGCKVRYEEQDLPF